MFIKKEKPLASQTEKDLPLKKEEIEKVSGGVKWGDGDRPTLKDANRRKRKNKNNQEIL